MAAPRNQRRERGVRAACMRTAQNWLTRVEPARRKVKRQSQNP